MSDDVSRRAFLKFATTALAVGPTILASATTQAAESATPVAANSGVVRIGSVSTAVEGGLLPSLVKSFNSQAGVQAVFTLDDEPYQPEKVGKYDLIISHFGHRDTEEFVFDKRLGLWPRTIFSNQVCLIGPTSDPAKVRGMTDLVQAFRKIAAAKAPYVLNKIKGVSYLTEILWEAAGRPAKGTWFIDSPGAGKKDAIALAAEHNAYVIWGLTPFLRENKVAHGALMPLVTADPLLQRIMVSVVVDPERVPGVNLAGASRFQEYLLLPSTQAKVLATHYAGHEQAIWAPAGRHNAGAVLPL
jgi:tungstate transport system substrate-binding protein